MTEDSFVPLVLMALGAVCTWLAWVALGDYRRMFRENPRLLMTLEVFAVIAEIGGLGYLAATLAFAGIWLLTVGLAMGIDAILWILRNSGAG